MRTTKWKKKICNYITDDVILLHKATLATKLNSTRLSTASATKLNVSATKSTELATMSTAISCRIQVVADLSPKPATKSTALATKLTVLVTVDFVADLSPASATVDFVASVYQA